MNHRISAAIKKYLPHVLIIAGFAAFAYIYAPYVLQGRIVNQSDISSWKGMSHEILTHNEAHPEDPALWTGSMFGGMPATQISVDYKGDFTSWLYDLLFWGERPPSYFIISMIGGFLLFLAFGINPYLSAAGAIAITFCSYNMQIIQVGHNTKMVAIAFMPWVLAALVYAYRKRPVLGALLFALALSFQIKANHPQITYYLAFIVAGYVIAELCGAIKSKTLPKWLKTSSLILVAGIAGLATNANKLLPTYEYAEYTMRGGSELTHDKENQTGDGLKLDYATAWSYGITETPNLLIPNFNGGSSYGEIPRNSETFKLLQAYYQNAESLRKAMPVYWGPQPFTAGPMYLGAVSLFLFVFGMCVIKGRYKWWIAGVSLLALLLAWGSHLMWFSELFFKYAPLYNKFRTVSMILVILQITVPVLGILGVNEVLFGNSAPDRKKTWNGLITALSVTGGICLVFSLFPSLAGSFSSASDASVFGEGSPLIERIRADRRSMLRADAFRSLVFILLTALILACAISRRLKGRTDEGWKRYAGIAAIGVLLVADLWSVDKRYLNGSHFVTVRNFDSQFSPRPVDNYILGDPDPHYRVLDLSLGNNIFNDAIVSYHHKTIGGYSPAKLQRYQDLIDFHISPEIYRLVSDLNSGKGTGYYPVIAMLNTKYLITDGNQYPLEYDRRLGNAWFVGKSVTAADADGEMALLGKIDPAREAVIYNPDTEPGTVTEYPGGGEISLTEYSPNRMAYSCSSPSGGLAVFSEIYYPAGWKAFVDGKESKILRADYVLRALEIEEGDHNIEFIYAPESFRTGEAISAASSLAILACLAIYIIFCTVSSGKRRL